MKGIRNVALRTALIGGVVGASIAFGAIAQQKVKLTLGGKALSLDSVQVKGKTYVSLDQLKAQMAVSGGANQMSATEGVMNELLFNGVFRFRVRSFAFDEAESQWLVNVELRNGTSETRTPGMEGMDGMPEKTFYLVMASGNTLTLGPNSNNETQTTITYKKLPAGATALGTLRYLGTADDKPVKLLCEFKAFKGLPYVKDPSFRVDLTKSKP